MSGMRFAGQVAVVTGGASGIGLAVARRLAAEGARVSIWDIDEQAARRAGCAVHIAAIDQSDSVTIKAAAQSVDAALGRVDILVVSAGITGPNAPTEDYPEDAWRRVIDVNLNGVFYCNQAVIPLMRRHNYGRIVNIASVAGKEGNPNASAYSASKAGVIGLTKSLGKELATTGITANVVTPSAVRTPIFAQMSQSHIDFMLSKIPMGRFGTLEEVTALVCWLASAEASFSTAAVFDCTGGRSTY